MLIGQFKINTATLLCSAFIFRLLFINIGIVSTFNAKENSTSVKKHFSSVTKRRKQLDPSSNSGNIGYSAVEILEEDSNEKDQFKLNSFHFIQVFYSLVESKIEYTLKKITSSNKHFSYNSSNRYLEYQVFRI